MKVKKEFTAAQYGVFSNYHSIFSGLANTAFHNHILNMKERSILMLLELLSAITTKMLYLILHIENAGSFPKPLSAKEEKKALEQMASGDTEAKNRLIEHNLRLVAHIIKKYYSNYSDQEDLISIGTIGLIKGINSFDYTKGTRLATYASRCIENAILSQRNKQQLRWKTMNLLGQNGLCSAA